MHYRMGNAVPPPRKVGGQDHKDLQDTLQYCPPIMATSTSGLFTLRFPTKPLRIPLLPHTSQIPRPLRSSRDDHRNNI